MTLCSKIIVDDTNKNRIDLRYGEEVVCVKLTGKAGQ